MTIATESTNVTSRDNDGYEEFSQAIRQRFTQSVADNKYLFTTDATGLFDAFLAALPDEARQHYTCNSCRRFVDTYGGLVTIDYGVSMPAMWHPDVPIMFELPVFKMVQIVKKANVTGVFLSGSNVLGTPVTGDWHHMSVLDAPKYSNRLLTPFQAMAEKTEDYKILERSLAEFSQANVEQAVRLLDSEALYRSEKCLGVAKWLLALQKSIATTKSAKTKANLIWLAVAGAPTGYAHIRSSMIGTLLDDIQAGMGFDAVASRFAEKMHPLQYQRPQAAPSAGNIVQAEKLVEKLGIQRSLLRRFARVEEINALWRPQEQRQEPTKEGVFAHLKPKSAQEVAPPMNTPVITMTWDKFQRVVLPTAHKIEFMVTSANNHYSAIVTAVDMEAPPILQWDNEEQRNPFSWYVYNNGSSPAAWGLSTGWCEVTAVCLQPSMWYGDFSHQAESVYFILNGAKDSRYERSGCALFPEILKSSLREVRSTIEAYSKSATIEGYDEATANGLRLQKGAEWNATVRVTSAVGVTEYKLDRWD